MEYKVSSEKRILKLQRVADWGSANMGVMTTIGKVFSRQVPLQVMDSPENVPDI